MYDEQHYTLLNGSNDSSTLTMKLYKGRMKGSLDFVSSYYGFVPFLIKYKNNKRVLKYIDKNHFIQCLKDNGLIK